MGNAGILSLNRLLEDSQCSAKRFFEINFLFAMASGCPRIRQQVRDQLIHAACAIDNELQILLGFWVQLSRALPLHYLREGNHSAKRLLKIVRSDISKLSQV